MKAPGYSAEAIVSLFLQSCIWYLDKNVPSVYKRSTKITAWEYTVDGMQEKAWVHNTTS